MVIIYTPNNPLDATAKRERERQRDRETERERERETERQRDRETERQRDRERERGVVGAGPRPEDPSPAK